jgi:pyridinium-3,5-biscarboxylic acid mononucleotide sulfurtransferase
MSTEARNLKSLKDIIGRYRSVVVAFSGGVDSTFLARVCRDTLGPGHVLLITATSSTYPFFELQEAKDLAVTLQLPHRVIVSEETDIPGFADNPPDRCYYCKSELFKLITHIASQEGYEAVFDGSNFDDTRDHRPGRRALKELGVVSPLCDATFTKEQIRALSREMGLSTADKPSYACLASRFPYGERITPEKLQRVGKAEQAIRTLGLGQFRVRSHGDQARVELAPERMDEGWAQRAQIEVMCREAGFTFVAIDTRGYRTGAMNEALSPEQRE